jgi:hypothetical protein
MDFFIVFLPFSSCFYVTKNVFSWLTDETELTFDKQAQPHLFFPRYQPCGILIFIARAPGKVSFLDARL